MKTRTEPFRSYSANFEDVLLDRVFGDTSDGFFVDVGAAHPVMENDLYALYCRGWRGVNIEPSVAWFADIERLRPHDRNLNIALSDKQEEQIYFEVIDTGLSTLDPDEATRCREQGWQVVEHRLQTRTLASILEEQPPSHFGILKVDVEGFEERVLLGNDWDRFRPALILVEATLPERRARRQTGIPDLLASKRYRHLHFDGLNDFYAEQDFHDADEVLGPPPGVFDQFVSYRVAELEEYNQSLRLTGEAAAQDSQSRVNHLSVSLETTKQHAANLKAMLENSSQQLARAADERAEFARALDNQTCLAATARSRQQRAEQSRAALSDDVTRLKTSLAELLLQTRQYGADLEATHRDREELLLLRGHVHQLQTKVRRLDHELDHQAATSQQEWGRLSAQLDENRGWLDAVRRSTSWQVTRPVRVVTRGVLRTLKRIR